MIAEFRELYGSADGLRVFRAPGRVNLIGEHTDYNLGFVLPVALDLATYVATAPSGNGKLEIYSEHLGTGTSIAVGELRDAERTGTWTDYPVGVAQELIRAGFPIQPGRMLVRSSVPEGSGLSSSAALEVSSALALLNGRSIAPLDLARLCQRAEVQFVGMPCGIMDQYISVFGREQSAVEIDCRSLEHRDVRLPGGVVFIAVNSMVKHALAGSAYRDRVRECAEAVELLRRHYPEASSLRDVSPEQFEAAADSLPDVIRRRARHIVTESDRVHRFVAASEKGDLAEMGRLFVASHRSLQHDYEVSCPELDLLVELARNHPLPLGSRMTGAGFGGCTLHLVPSDAGGTEEFVAHMTAGFEKHFGRKPENYLFQASNGAKILNEGGDVP